MSVPLVSLLEVWLKGSVLLGGTWLLSRLPWTGSLRPWRAGFLGVALITVLGALPAAWEWRLPARPARVLSAAGEAWTTTAGPGSSPAIPPRDGGSPPGGTESGREPPATLPWAEGIVRAWGIGALLAGLWLGWGYAVARRWAGDAEPLDDEAWVADLARMHAAMGAGRLPRLAIHPRVPGPCAVGALRPVILLPPEARSWDRETRGAVLRHELAHVTAGDAWWRILRCVLLTIHWPNPLLWLASAWARREEELAADRTAVAGGIDPTRYASILLALARRNMPVLPPAAAHSMARLSAMEGRFQAILAGPAPALRTWRRRVAKGAALIAVLGAGCSRFNAGAGGSVWLAPEVPRPSVSVGKLNDLLHTPASLPRRLKVSCRVTSPDGQGLPVDDGLPFPDGSGKRRVFEPSFSLWPGRPARVDSLQEFVHPTRFTFPDTGSFHRLASAAGRPVSFPVTPTTPNQFDARMTGWTMELEWVENQKAFLVLGGHFKETTFDGFINCAGEPFSRITAGARTAWGSATEVVLTDNLVTQPTFTTRETPFQVAALPGKSYRLPLNLKRRGCVLEIVVQAADEGR